MSGPMKAILAAAFLIMSVASATTAPITNIVAIGASNTLGFGVRGDEAYPARLQALLTARGYHVNVANAGVLFDTTDGMLRRLDSAVPEGTRIVILQPGGKEQRAANLEAMAKRLRERRIKVIVFDPVIQTKYYQPDGIHLNAEGHAMFAARLLPLVIKAIAD